METNKQWFILYIINICAELGIILYYLKDLGT